MKKLENNLLEGVNIGDYLCLKAENEDLVSGFVVKSTVGRVKLSHEHPKNKSPNYLHFTLHITKGDRAYWLGDFSEYEVMNQTNNKKQD